MIAHDGSGMLIEIDRAPIDLVFVRCKQCGHAHAWWVSRHTGRRLMRAEIMSA